MNTCSNPLCGKPLIVKNGKCVYCGHTPGNGEENLKNPYSQYKGQHQIKGVNKDKFGNAQGAQFDLAKDGAFKGCVIAVLHLYTGEGFDFHLPEQALIEKGFNIKRIEMQPYSAKPIDKYELIEILANASQLWLISNAMQLLNEEHLKIIQSFFMEKGKSLYLWGDNAPYFADTNFVGNSIFNCTMQGDTPGDQLVSVMVKDNKQGFISHDIFTGIEKLYEGITIATVDIKNSDMKPLIIGSAGNIVACYYEKDGRRAIMDGGFTRLYYKWDSAGTARYVKNAAAWLANYEKFGDSIFNEQETGKRICQNCNKSLILSAGKCVYCGKQIK